MACAAAIEVIKTIDREKLLERALYIGKIVRHSFEGLKERHPAIKEVR